MAIDMILIHLHLLFYLTTSAPLKIQSCIHLKSIDSSWNPSNQGQFYFELTVDNNPSTLKTTHSFNPPDGTSNTNINGTFCWEYDTTNITITTFKPDSALNIQIKMRNSTEPLNALANFKHPQIITTSQPSFDNKTINSINFNLYHKINMPNTLLKISNRNFIIKRNCFQLYAICFYEIDESNPNCINTMDALTTNPSGADATVFRDVSTTTDWSPPQDTGGTPNGRGDGKKCYEPYQQYVIFDISDIEFTSIGLGILQPISADTIGTSNSAPRYWSFIFGDKTVIGNNYGNDMLYDQYWVVDLFDSNVFINENTVNVNEPFFNINPLYFMLDTKPSENRIRMDQIYFGRPEQYLVNVSLFRFASSNNNEKSMFTTWTWIGSKDAAIWDDGSPTTPELDNQTFKIGQYAQIACKNAINYDINNTPVMTYYLSSIKPTSENDKCYGTAGTLGITATPTIQICVYDNQVYYPPMAWRLESNFGNAGPLSIISYCQEDISLVNSFDECIGYGLTALCDGPETSVPLAQCDVSGQGGGADDAPYYWECVLENVTQINTAYPTMTPTKAPTETPITLPPSQTPTITPTLTPTRAPYTPGTPSRAPVTYEPSTTPTQTPTDISYDPSTTPTRAPTNDPSTTPTTTTTLMPTISPSIMVTDPDDPGDDTIINIYNYNFGLIEIIIAAIICCICCCLLLLLILLKSKKKKKAEDDAEVVAQGSPKAFQDDTYNQSTRQSFNVTAGKKKGQIELESQYTDGATNTNYNEGTNVNEYNYYNSNDDYGTTGNGEDRALDVIAGNVDTPQQYQM